MLENLLSRVEKILKSRIDNVPYTKKPMSRVEELLMQYNRVTTLDIKNVHDRLDLMEQNYNVLIDELSEIVGILLNVAGAAILDSTFEEYIHPSEEEFTLSKMDFGTRSDENE